MTPLHWFITKGRALMLALLTGCLLTLSLPSGATTSADNLLGELGLTQAQPRYLPAAQAFMVKAHQQQEKVQIAITLTPGYYLYKEKFRFTLSAGKTGTPSWPQAQFHQDDYFGRSEVYFDGLTLDLPIIEAPAGAVLTIGYQGCTEGMCYPPGETRLTLTTAVTKDSSTINPLASTISSDTARQQLDHAKEQGLAITLGIFFVLGVGLAFTPCMLPMYPILSSVVLGNTAVSTRRAFWLALSYIQGMALCYTLLGLAVASAGAGLQAFLQQPAVLIGFSLLFTLLAATMFGLIHLHLPGRWQAALHRLSGAQRGGSVMGCFVMGALAALVCSPCTTAPLTGALLYVAQSGDRWLGGAALYALSLGMGLPLLLLATFGKQCLPRNGLWMQRVKVLFGFILLAVPLLLLERLLPTFWLRLGWLLLAGSALSYLALTLLPGPRWRLSALLLILLLAKFGWQQWPAEHQEQLAFASLQSPAQLQQELQAAEAAGMGVVVDFYADWCVACKQLEQETFSDPAVQQRLQGYRLLRVDVTVTTEQERQLMAQLKVPGLPAMLFFQTAEAQPSTRIDGFLPPEGFVRALPLCRPEQTC